MVTKIYLPLIFALAGCTTTAHMDRQTMNNMQIDCNHAQEQIDFLQSQWPSPQDTFVNSMMIRGWFGFISSVNDGTYNERRDWDQGGRTNAIRIQIDNIRNVCARQLQR